MCTVQTKSVYNTCMSQHSKDLINSTNDIFYAKNQKKKKRDSVFVSVLPSFVNFCLFITLLLIGPLYSSHLHNRKYRKHYIKRVLRAARPIPAGGDLKDLHLENVSLVLL